MRKDLFSLGNIHLSDFLEKNEDSQKKEKFELKLVLDTDTGLVRLSETVNPTLMYGKYWYRSGINSSMKKDLLDVVHSVGAVKQLLPDEVWLDIACNDGTLLSHVGDLYPHIKRLGIDPADDSYVSESEKHADQIIQDYFSLKTYNASKFCDKKVNVVTTIAMFYDLDDPVSFISDVRKIIDENGVWVVQMSYTPLMLSQLAFDNICHEHVYYYSLFNFKRLLEENGFRVVDVQLNTVNGGSFRVFAVPSVANETTFANQPYRDVADFRIRAFLAKEKEMCLDSIDTWMQFYDQIKQLRDQTLSFIKKAKSEGKTIWGYGASTKGNTLLQYFGLDNTTITAIAERSPYKYGLKTVGTNIPILSEKEMRIAKPDYILILPWHFIGEFIEREKDYLSSGGKFIVPCPKFQVIGK